MDTIETPAGQLITDFLNPNEVCHLMRQGPVGQRWVEILWVLRKGYWTKDGAFDPVSDVMAKHVTDRGPASNFIKIAPMIIPGDGELTVAEMQYEAERHRHDLFAWNHLQRVQAESTLIADVARGRLVRRELIANRSVFGPALTVQRNQYSSTNTWRKFFEERAQRTGKRTSKPEGGFY